MDEPELLTTGQVAARLGVDRRHVRRLHQQGKLPGRRVGPRVLVFARADVEAYAAEQARNPPKTGWPRGRPRSRGPAVGDNSAG